MSLQNQLVCCKAVELLAALPKSSVGAIVTDPPFFVSIGSGPDTGFGRDPWEEVTSLQQAVDWSMPLACQTARVLRPGGAAVFMGGSQSLSAWELAAAKYGLNWMAELTVLWNQGKPRARNFGSLFTSIRWYSKPGARHQFNSGDRRSIYSNVIVCSKVPIPERVHIAQKPVELTNFLISLLTQEGDMVVDPFCGSGSTLVSAVQCERPWLGGDSDPDSIEKAERRIRNAEFEETRPIYLWVNNRLVPVEG